MRFKLSSQYKPAGDQPRAIEELVNNLEIGVRHQTLLGVTGSGKTFTLANVIGGINRPALVISHNKTLAAQLHSEFKGFFPENSVEYFVSYYDYYQPEAYVPQRDLYIEKDCSINDEIDRMRHAATRALLERRDVIIVASVSCIYGLGSPEAYHGLVIPLEIGMEVKRRELIKRLTEIHYTRNEYDFHRGTFRARGDVIEVFASHMEERALRIELWEDEIDVLLEFDPLTGEVLKELEKTSIYPATHYVSWEEMRRGAISTIKMELEERVRELKEQGKEVEAQRLWQRTTFDLEMIQEIGYCKGIENYSRHFTGRAPGDPPPTLIDYMPKDALFIIDESHVTIPQLRGMVEGDRSRKKNLINYGFRLPSAYDNRPLTFEEFEERVNQVIYVSATPGDYELEKSRPYVVEQVIRPTGLMEPRVEVHPARDQVDHLYGEIRKRVDQGDRVLVTTLTKRMAEDLCEHYQQMGLKVCYLHSEIDTIERTRIIRDLRLGRYDVLIGVNLLREGLDIPEVSLVAILDADREGFLRSQRSLIQTAGRAARNVWGTVIFYAETVTQSMDKAIKETERRRCLQEEYNREHGITPTTIKKSIHQILTSVYEADYYTVPLVEEEKATYKGPWELEQEIARLEKQMKAAADALEFEKAALIRDEIKELKKALESVMAG